MIFGKKNAIPWDGFETHPVATRHICYGGGGGLFGGGIGSILGTILGVALAPETGGLSLVAPVLGGALGGAGGNVLGDVIGGQPIDPLGVATAGLGGAAGGFFGGPAVGGLLGDLGGGAGGLGSAIAAGATPAGLAAPAGAEFAQAALPAITDAAGGAGPAFLGGVDSLAGGLGGASAAAAASPFGDVGSLISSLGLPETAAGETAALGGDALTTTTAPALSGLEGAAGLPAGIANPEQAANLIPGALGIGDAPTSAAPALSGTVADAAGGAAAATPLDPATFPSESAITKQILGGSLGPDVAASTAAALTPTGGLSSLFGPGSILGDVGSWIGRNKDLLGGALAVGNVGKSLLAPSAIPGQDQLGADAALLRQIANDPTLKNLAQTAANRQPNTTMGGTAITVPKGIAERNATGTLTPEQQAQSKKLLEGQIAQIKSRYAQMGLAGSTSELQDIQAAERAQQAADAQTIAENQRLALSASGQLSQSDLAQTGQAAGQAQTATQQGISGTAAAASQALQATGAADTVTAALAQQQLEQDKQLSDAIAQLAAAGLYSGAYPGA